MVTFRFLSQNVRRWQGPINSTLSFNECRLSEGNILHSEVVGS